MLSLIPTLKRDQPTSRIEIGVKKVGPNTDTVEIRHNGRRAFFYVDLVDNSIVDGIGNKLRMHQNAAAVFGGIDRGNDFLIDPDATKHDVVECTSATIRTSEIASDELEPFLRENDYLLHRMEEVVPKGDTLATFEVVAMEPAEHATLRVTVDTDFEFVDIDEADPSNPGRATAGDDSVLRMSTDPNEAPESPDSDTREIEEVIEATSDEEVASIVDELLAAIEAVSDDENKAVSDDENKAVSDDENKAVSDLGTLSMGDDNTDELAEPVEETADGRIEEEIEQVSDDEVASMVDEIIGDIESVGETAGQIADDEAAESDDNA